MHRHDEQNDGGSDAELLRGEIRDGERRVQLVGRDDRIPPFDGGRLDALGPLLDEVADRMCDRFVRRFFARLQSQGHTLLPAQVAPRATLEDRLVSTDEAARIAGVEPKTIRRWVHEGKLSNRGKGRKIRVALSELTACRRAEGAHDGSNVEAIADKMLSKAKR